MRKHIGHYTTPQKKEEDSLSGLAIKGIEKTEQVLGDAKKAVRFYKKHPNYFKLGALAVLGLAVYLSSGDDKKNETPTK